MTKDKIIRVRASEHDKAVLKALTTKFNEDKNMPITFTESDMVRFAIDRLAKLHLSDDQMQGLRGE